MANTKLSIFGLLVIIFISLSISLSTLHEGMTPTQTPMRTPTQTPMRTPTQTPMRTPTQTPKNTADINIKTTNIDKLLS